MPKASSLREYVNAVFHPAVVAWQEAQSGSEAAKRFSAVSLVEAYGWISLGVQSEAFQADVAREIVIPSVDAIQAANEIAEREAVLQSGTTGEIRRLLESKNIFPKSFSARFALEFKELPEAPTLLTLLLTESSAFTDSGGKFVQTLNFAYDTDWEIEIARLRDEVFLQEADASSNESLFEGYLRSLQHMDRIADLMTVEGTRAAEWPARGIMRIEVASIHGWQLNFRSSVFTPRFNEVTEAVESRLRAEGAADGIRLEEGGFIRGVQDLQQRYLESLGYLLKATAR